MILGNLKYTLPILAALLLVANAILLVKYNEGEATRQKVRADALAAAQRLDALEQPDAVEHLKSQLADAEAQLAIAQGLFPREITAYEIVDLVATAAANSGVSMTSWNAPREPVVERIGSADYKVARYNLGLRGPQAALVAFLNRVERGPFSTLVINPREMTENENITGSWTADVELVTYVPANPPRQPAAQEKPTTTAPGVAPSATSPMPTATGRAGPVTPTTPGETGPSR